MGVLDLPPCRQLKLARAPPRLQVTYTYSSLGPAPEAAATGGGVWLRLCHRHAGVARRAGRPAGRRRHADRGAQGARQLSGVRVFAPHLFQHPRCHLLLLSPPCLLRRILVNLSFEAAAAAAAAAAAVGGRRIDRRALEMDVGSVVELTGMHGWPLGGRTESGWTSLRSMLGACPMGTGRANPVRLDCDRGVLPAAAAFSPLGTPHSRRDPATRPQRHCSRQQSGHVAAEGRPGRRPAAHRAGGLPAASAAAGSRCARGAGAPRGCRMRPSPLAARQEVWPPPPPPSAAALRRPPFCASCAQATCR